MPEGLADPLLFAAGALVLVAAVRWWRPELPRRWAVAHALLTFAFFAVPLTTSRSQVPTDIAYRGLPWFEDLTEELQVDNPLLADVPRQMLPFRTLVRERWLSLEAPLWTHEVGTGQPLLGNAQSAPFAPLHLMTLPVPPIRGLTLAAAWQVLLGLLLMHALVLACRPDRDTAGGGSAPWPVQAGAATGAVAFALSAYSVVWLYHPLSMVAMWIPGVVLGILALGRGERRAMTGLVISALGLAVSGHPETAAHTALLAAAIGAVLLARGPEVGRWRFAGRAVLAALLTACLAAPVLLPVIDVLPEGERSTMLRTGADQSIHPPPFRLAALLPLVQPLAFGSPRDGDWSGPANFNEYCSEYAGAAAVAVALAGVAVLGSWRLAGALLGGLLALLGALKLPPTFQALEALPVFGDAAHGRLRLFWALSVALVVGVAVPAVARSRWGPLVGSLALLGAAAAIVLAPPPFGSVHQRLWWGVVLAGLVATAASLAIPRFRPGFPAVLLVCTVADLFVLGVHYHALVPARHQLAPPDALAWLKARHDESETPFRVVGEGPALLPNLPAIYGLWSPFADDPTHPYAASRIVEGRLQSGRWRRGPRTLLQMPFDVPMLRMLAVRYVLAPHRRRLPPPWEPMVNEVGGRIWRLPEPLDLFFVPRRVRTVDRPDLATAVTLRNPDFRRLAVVADPEAPPGRGPPVGQDGRVWLRRVRPNGFELVAESDEGALVASSVTAVRGWRASVDGEPAEPVTVNGAFLGVRVPPGVHGVELVYSPAGWRRGWALCGGALAALLVAGAVRFRRRGAARPPAGSGAP